MCSFLDPIFQLNDLIADVKQYIAESHLDAVSRILFAMTCKSFHRLLSFRFLSRSLMTLEISGSIGRLGSLGILQWFMKSGFVLEFHRVVQEALYSCQVGLLSNFTFAPTAMSWEMKFDCDNK